MRRLDAWFARRLFHPPIIWLCQQTGATQWAIYRYAWWVAALLCLWVDDHSSWPISAWLVLFALIRTLSAGLTLNRPVTASFGLRLLLWAVLGFDVVTDGLTRPRAG